MKIKWEKTGESPQLSESVEQAKLGQAQKWVWILEIWSEISSGFRETGSTSPPRIPSSTRLQGSGAGCKSCHRNHRLEHNVGRFISFIIHVCE